MGTKKMVKLKKRNGILMREDALTLPGTLAPRGLSFSVRQSLPKPTPDSQPATRVLHSVLVPPIGTLAEASGQTKPIAV